MTKVRTAKNKGSCFEYDCQESLGQNFEDIYRTSERGFQLMYDLQTDKGKSVFECKRLKGISWNQAVKFYEKLESVTPKGYSSYLLFKSNHQPCLVMVRHPNGYIQVVMFEAEFGVEFIKHTPIKRGKKSE